MTMDNGGLPLYKAFLPGRPWVLGIQNQVVSYCGIGLCDPLLQNSTRALEPFTYAHVLFAWSMVAGDGTLPNVAGDDLEIETEQTRVAFQAGVGETIPGGWWIQTISDTDTFKSGTPVDRGFMFLATGVITNALDPFQRGGTGDSADDPKFFPAWLGESDSGPGYSFLIQKFHINYTAMSISFGDTGCKYRIGPLALWPTWGHPSGEQTVRNGLVATPGMYLPFTTAVCVGSRDDVKQVALTMSTGQGARIQSGTPGTDIPSSDAPITNDDGTVYAPVFVALVGYIVCVPIENYCGIPMLSADEVILVRSRLGLSPMAGPPAVIPTPG